MTLPSDDVRAGDGAPSAGQDDLASLPTLIASIVETMRKADLERLEVQRGDFHLSLRSFARSKANQAVTSTEHPTLEGDLMDGDSAEAGHHIVTSPMIGTFYAAPAPGEPPFVQPGDEIEQGQVIGIVEAMKIMNEIISDRPGTVVEILAENGETVEYGSPLVRLSTSA